MADDSSEMIEEYNVLDDILTRFDGDEDLDQEYEDKKDDEAPRDDEDAQGYDTGSEAGSSGKGQENRKDGSSNSYIHRRPEPARAGHSERGTTRKRRPSYDDYGEARRYTKRSRTEHDREGYYRDREHEDRYSGRSRSRYGGMRRDRYMNWMPQKIDLMHVSYSDYLRAFGRIPPMPMPGHGPAPPSDYGQPPPPYPYGHDRPQDYPPAEEYPPQQHSRSSRREDKRSYERDVENFPRHPAHASRERRGERHQYRK